MRKTYATYSVTGLNEKNKTPVFLSGKYAETSENIRFSYGMWGIKINIWSKIF